MKITGTRKPARKLDHEPEVEIIVNEDIEAVVHFGAGNIKTVHLPAETRTGQIRMLLRRKCRTMTKALVTLVTGEVKEFS